MIQAQLIQAKMEEIFGKEIYLVGGSVRDITMGIAPKDYDFTTPLSPDEIEAKIRAAERKPYLIGKKFGTIGMKLDISSADEKSQFIYTEITTHRIESYDGNSRKPQVEFTKDLDLDLSRRDLTINAMALVNGEIYDPFNGLEDIKNRTIKAVGNPVERINEDPLRMLRVVRFATRYNYKIDNELTKAIQENANQIMRVSRERWVDELDKIFMTHYLDYAVATLNNLNLLRFILPELKLYCANNATEFDYHVDIEHDIDEHWKILLYNIGEPFCNKQSPYFERDSQIIRKELINGIAARLKFSNKRTKKLLED